MIRARGKSSLSGWVIRTVPPADADRLRHPSRTTSPAALSSRRPRKRGWRRRPSRVHSVKPTWATSSRLDPGRAALLDRARVGERRVVAAQRARAARPGRRSVARSKPGADLAGVAQLAVVVVAEQQRAELLARALRRGVAADHELLSAVALELQPVARARRCVYGLSARLAISPSQPLRQASREERLAVAVAVGREAQRAVEARARRAAAACARAAAARRRRSRRARAGRTRRRRPRTRRSPRCCEARRSWSAAAGEGHDLAVHDEASAAARAAERRGDLRDSAR